MADPIPLGTGVTSWVVENRCTRNVPNVCLEPLSNIVAGTLDEPEAFVCVPLMARERVLGALNVYRNGEDPFSDEEVELVERFATMAALAYDSARQRDTLREQVRRDGLTGLLNHRACHERLREALADGGPVGVVLLDLDHFKLINDAHGHAEGDRALAATAERLRTVVRAGDTVGRLGGEEFVFILPGADAEAAEDCAERARAALAELTVRGRPLAASAGVAAAPADGTDAAVLLENADAALYWAKRSGRGRTARYVRGAVRPEAEQRNEIAGLLEQGVERDPDRVPAGRRARHGPRRRLRGADADRPRAAARARRVVRAGAPCGARRGARGAGAARRARRPRPPRGHVPGR